MSGRESLTPWGETWEALANTAIADRSCPPFLVLAAVRARLGDDSELRRLVADAVALASAPAEKETR